MRNGTSCYHAVSENSQLSTGCISFDGNGLANARLIAAAPDLLEACRLAKDACRDNLKMYCYKNEHALMAAFKACEAAIAKAEGHSQGSA